MAVSLKKTSSAQLTEVDISEWTDDAKGFVKALSTRERMIFTDCVAKYLNRDLPETERAESILSGCVMVLVDSTGNQLFSMEDIPELMECSYLPVNRIAAVVTSQEGGISFVKN